MHVVLVNVPFASIAYPSLALGILKASVSTRLRDVSVDVVDANLDFVDWAVEHLDLTYEEYSSCETSVFSGYSEWIFSSSLYGVPTWNVNKFTEHMRGNLSERFLDRVLRLHEASGQFIGDLAARILDLRPEVVGFSSTFAQNTAALATARLLKLASPETTVVFGGANCDEVQGEALHRNFPFVDYVVRGDGEQTFPDLLEALRSGTGLGVIPGLCRRAEDGTSVFNPMGDPALARPAFVTPDFGDYYERRAASVAAAWVEPKLVVEGSRGCWWGQKHQCTFCGLNGSQLSYRSVQPDRFVDVLLELVRRHSILDVVTVDNILDMNYLTTALPRLREADYDLRISFEIKANLRLEHLEALAAAGVTFVQPGIESLSGTVLKLMNKGVTGCQNVRLLRDLETLGINAAWNHLFGFPGEDDADYEFLMHQLPSLYHLPPPHHATRMAVERFSPYFSDPCLGFTDLTPAWHFGYIYDLPEKELAELVYLFDAPIRGIGADLQSRLEEAMAHWQREYPRSQLSYDELADEIIFVNTRPDFDWAVHRITDPTQLVLFRLLDQPHTPAALARKAAQSGDVVDALEVATLLQEWRGLGLVFEDCGSLVHVVPRAANQGLKRMAHVSADVLVPALDLLSPGRMPEGGMPEGSEGVQR